jgi:hypothetical protein
MEGCAFAGQTEEKGDLHKRAMLGQPHFEELSEVHRPLLDTLPLVIARHDCKENLTLTPC